MNLSKLIVSYAQYNEDIILYALLHDVKKGFYVDVGANDPTVDSVTKLFYEKGWRGINIEPIESLYKKLQADRPRDINLNCGIGERPGRLNFRQYKDLPAHSTFDNQQKTEHDKSIKYKDSSVEVKTLEAILSSHKPGHIHFMKIDVEGYECEVITGNDWKNFRPEIICIEANHISKTKDWRPLLKGADYKLFIADGFNEYYLAKESWQRTDDFSNRVTRFYYDSIKQYQYNLWSGERKQLFKVDRLYRDLEVENQKLQNLASLSLKSLPLRRRLKRAIYGLTIDWWKYKKQSKN